ncbi:MAG: ATP-binding protein [Sphingosinicella sp.]
MSVIADPERPITGRVDAAGRLIAADPELADLNARSGGSDGTLSVPQIAALAQLARRLGVPISRPAIAADGAHDIELWVRAAPEGDEVALSITGWDERPAQEPAPTPGVEREQDFLRSTADWIWETDETLKITALAGAASVTGRSDGEMIGKPLTDLFRFHEGAGGQMPILTALAQHSRFLGQVANLQGSDESRYILSGVPLIDGMGRFAGFRGSAVLLAEEPAERPTPPRRNSPFSERLDMALRTPLAFIVENAERLQTQPDGPLRRNYTGYAADIAAAARHLLTLVDDLIDLQAIERADFHPDAEPIDLADLARRAAGLLSVRAAARGIAIDAPAAGEGLPAIGDFTRALQVLVNLIGNAINHSPDGGQVWVRSDGPPGMAAIIVADQGRGIAPENQDRIFERFERIEPGESSGSGLGLYIARRLARAMGGDVSVDSAPGQGARFVFTLPANNQ